MEKKKMVCVCDVCGRELFDGDEAYATSTGNVSLEAEGFAPGKDPWLTVACAECGEKISDAVASVESATKNKIERPN